MKRRLLILTCIVGLEANAGSVDLMWADGNDYFNNCSNIRSRQDDVAMACYIASSNSFSAGQMLVATLKDINVIKYGAHYKMGMLNGVDAHLQLISHLQKYPEQRNFKLVTLSAAAVLENYPVPDSLIKELR